MSHLDTISFWKDFAAVAEVRGFDRRHISHSLGALRLLGQTWTVHDVGLHKDWKRVSKSAESLARSWCMEDEPTYLPSTNFYYYVT